MVPAAENGNYP